MEEVPDFVEEEPGAVEEDIVDSGTGGDVSEFRGRYVSESAAAFPPSVPVLPSPPQPIVQHFYLMMSDILSPPPPSASSSSRPPPPSPSSSSRPPPPSPSSSSRPHRSRSRSRAPRQRLAGWCQQCGTQKANCFKLGDWECPTCGRHNYASKSHCTGPRCPSRGETWCKACKTWRSICFKEGDWACSNCQNHNYASKEVG